MRLWGEIRVCAGWGRSAGLLGGDWQAQRRRCMNIYYLFVFMFAIKLYIYIHMYVVLGILLSQGLPPHPDPSFLRPRPPLCLSSCSVGPPPHPDPSSFPLPPPPPAGLGILLE